MAERETPRRQEMGPKKYREWIHKRAAHESQKNLPFEISKPKKEKPLNTYYTCKKCDTGFFVGEETIVVICSKCGTLNKVKDIRKKGL